MIIKDAIRNGMRKHVISFVVDPNMEHGTVCKIGGLWFYFGGYAHIVIRLRKSIYSVVWAGRQGR